MQHVGSNKHDKAAAAHRAMMRTAEDEVRSALLDLHQALFEYGEKVTGVELDTRNFANFTVTIHTEPR